MNHTTGPMAEAATQKTSSTQAPKTPSVVISPRVSGAPGSALCLDLPNTSAVLAQTTKDIPQAANASPIATASIPRWRTLRCQLCRRPLQRALLVSGSAVQATCRRDKVTFVYVATEAGLLVMQRG